MKDIIIDTLVDALKLLPFLFIAFLIIEAIEHKLSNKSKQVISKSNKFGPFFGSLLGLFPQCGFSVVATNLYITRIVSLGTLISIYLTTSDEMLPILISEHVSLNLIIKILCIKFFIGLICGFVIDLIFRNKRKESKEDYHICEEEGCHCEHGIIHSSLKHTFKTILFIMIVSFILNICFHYFGEDMLTKLFMKDSFFSPFIASLIGLIPNCAASVMITELYLNNIINFATMISGLLTGSGVALLVLFKSNKNLKENIYILLSIYFIGALSGIIIKLIGMLL